MKKYNENNISELYGLLRSRAENIPPEVMTAVGEILADVKANGDAALIKYTEKFDKVRLSGDNFRLSQADIDAYAAAVPKKLRGVIERAAVNIRNYHIQQKQTSRYFEGDRGILGQRIMPLERVGVYVPGGTAAYPSTVLMNAIPAKIAGVDRIIMVTPPKADGLNPAVIFAAVTAGVDEIYTVGGAQSIAALAYGTEIIPRVDKIVGPGNIYVAMAKKLVYGTVDIDMIAGPSEILVIADENADPDYIAADLLSQAEHDKMASSVLISLCESLTERVEACVNKQLENSPRRDIASASVENFGALVTVSSLEKAAEIANAIAPEHLELAVTSPFDALPLIKNAGSVFLGCYTPEPVGDYYAGPNHVLPTNGTARFSSPLSVDSFIKKSSFSYYTEAELLSCADDIIEFAEAEGLYAHANAVRVRKEKAAR